MALRLIEIVLPEESGKELQELLKEHEVSNLWQHHLSDRKVLVRVLLSADKTEPVLDLLEKRYSTVEGFKVILLSVEASIPRPEPPEEKLPKHAEVQPEREAEPRVAGVSRHELYTGIADRAKPSKEFVILIALSTIVAAVGILRNNVAIIIGAMVIAPVLGPNVALSLATTLGDMDLARRALKAIAVGTLTVATLSVPLGYVLTVDPDIPEFLARTRVGFGDIALALASGSAGALAFRRGVASALIGVMVAVALLPPLVTFGLLLGSGYWLMSLGAMLLFLTNLICINLSGVTTFMLQGIRPRTWWEADRAKKATRIAIALWVFLLSALVVVIVLSQTS